MKRFPIQFLQSLLIFGAIFVLSCSPNTTLSTNPCSSPYNILSDCPGVRYVYFEVEVNPPLPLIPAGGGTAAGNITFQSPNFYWSAASNSYPLSTITTDCAAYDVNLQHPILVSLRYEHPYLLDSLNNLVFTPWIGQCHSVEIKAFDLSGSLLQSWFEPSVGVFATGINYSGYIYNFNTCGFNSNGFHQFGTLILPPCP
jgi:hypothetical protein